MFNIRAHIAETFEWLISSIAARENRTDPFKTQFIVFFDGYM